MSKLAYIVASGVVVLLGTAAVQGQTVRVAASQVVQHRAINLPAGTEPQNGDYWLIDTRQPNRKLPAQLVPAVSADGTVDSTKHQLLATIPGLDNASASAANSSDANSSDTSAVRTYRVVQGDEQVVDARFQLEETDHSMRLVELVPGADLPHAIWAYNHRTVTDDSIPETESRRSRSCYVHPVWGLQGEVLSDDFPKDHYHHHGIFWTWPYVKVGDNTYDLWMSNDIQQRFIKWLATDMGSVAAVLGVENGWFVGQQQVATERLWLRTYCSQPDYRVIDLSLTIEARDKPVTLQGRQQKSYGGLTFRYDVTPRKDATVRVPGKTLGFGAPKDSGSPDLLNTPLPWADLTTHIPGAAHRSGAAVFVDPQHPNFPPTWLTRTYGALCVGWPGVKAHTIPAGKSIRLDYRIFIHSSELDPQQLDRQYQAYRLGRE